MVICDNCGTDAPLGGILVDVMKHIDQNNDTPQKWFLGAYGEPERNRNADSSARSWSLVFTYCYLNDKF
jgi:hypothetical protein